MKILDVFVYPQFPQLIKPSSYSLIYKANIVKFYVVIRIYILLKKILQIKKLPENSRLRIKMEFLFWRLPGGSVSRIGSDSLRHAQKSRLRIFNYS